MARKGSVSSLYLFPICHQDQEAVHIPQWVVSRELLAILMGNPFRSPLSRYTQILPNSLPPMTPTGRPTTANLQDMVRLLTDFRFALRFPSPSIIDHFLVATGRTDVRRRAK